MIVVSDTSPLNYLVLIGAVNVLPSLFDQILAPSVVMRELNDVRAPQIVRAWAQSPPPWLAIANPLSRLALTASLDAGEADAISLAKERGIPNLLIDEYAGRQVAITEGLFALTTLAILESAAESNLVQLPQALAALQRTSYRVRPALIQEALDRDKTRKRPTGESP